MQEQHKAYRAFRIIIISIFALVFVVTLARTDLASIPWPQFLLLVAVAVICELVPVELGRDYCQVTLTLPLVVMSMMLYGAMAALIFSFSALVLANAFSWASAYLSDRYAVRVTDKAARFRWIRVQAFSVILPWIGRAWLGRHSAPFGWMAMNLIYNASHLALNSTIAAYAYFLVGGELLASVEVGSLSAVSWARTASAGLFALLVLFVGDTLIFLIGSTLYESNQGYPKSLDSFLLRCNIRLRQTLPSILRGDIFLGTLAAILIYLYVQIGTVAILVLFAPLYMIREAVSKTFLQVQAYRDTVTTLGTYMQRYHPYTRGHLKRVADMSERLARELRLPADSIMLMPDAGMLHDIGKVAVSEEILDKIGRLTDEEWAIIKQHPVKGAEIVSHLPYLDKIVDWVKYHHKWVDGSGYPDDGIRDGQIPIEAAIIAVADAFDAMTDDRDMSLDWVCDSCGYDPGDGSRPDVCPECGVQKRRVYRQPLSLDDAVDQLRRGAGTQFSPKVVKAFLRMLERDGVRVNA